ncbi:hypothetical protein CATMQ487_29570 [Sphaerotilus microaerophilus]|uniref:CHAT domain-containing protein n=2 Tax=Sphaerotilus microaerophilus TaxID=2914710 RepID=A0ABN6PNV1_9BURK|nr:hypothetical protein CATMQ487_29570 [Sphaerotilus sp. FB-5]
MALDVLGDDLEVVATLMGWVAGMHESLAQYALALPLCQRAIVIFEKVKGPDHPTTGTSLNNLAGLYLAMGEYAQAEPLYQRALAISEKAEGPDHPNTGRNLNNLSVLYQDMGQYSKAIPLLRRALAISEKTQGADHPSTGAVLNNLSLLYQHMGEYANALPLVQRALAISERSEGADHPNTSARRNNLAVLYRDLGRYNQALPLFQRALVISEKVEGPDHPTTGTVLNNLATLYQDMGQYTLALPLIQRALAISEKAEGPDHPATGRVLNNLSLLYTEMGQYALALPLLQRALAISEKAEGPNHPSTGTRLVNLAVLYQDLGQYAQALPLFERAMAISVKVGGPEHPITGTVLTHLAELHRAMGQYAQALPLSQRALAISEKVHGTDHPSTGTSLNGLANLHWSMGHYAQALPLSQRALAISDKALGSDHPSTGRRLNNLARLYLDMGQFAQALPLFYRAEQIGTASWNRELQWHAQSGIAALLAAQGDPTSAIFWGKQAVNTIQSLRGGLIKLDRELQTSFLNDKRWVYTELSQQLITAGRIPEAQRVMALLKEEELFDFVRRDADSAPASSELPLTGVERKAAEQYKVLGDRLATLAQEELRLQEIRRKGGATEADLARLAELEAPLAEARDAFMAFTTGLRQMLAGQAEHREKAALVDRQIESHQNLLAELGSAGQGVAAVQYVASREKLSIIVSTQAIQLAREVPIAEKDLNKHIAELRGLLQDPKLDPRAAAQRLHALLIEPILADLQAQNVHTLMLLQDGALRYLPFAALHDGRRYLVENYQLAIYTAAAQSGLGKSPAAQWQVAALGVTRAFPEQNFRALDAVRQELNGIVHPQVLPGQVYLDEKFNRTTLLNNLGRPVLHVASHFRFIEGSDQSFLLLGDGSRLSLADLRRMPRFNGVDLLTLSACDTATGGGLREDGREVEGLGAEVQKKGARAVLATLWPVADRSTGELMQRFYRAREGGQRNKAQALRQAQLALLGAAGGDAGSAGPNEPRGARPVAAAPGGGEGKPAPYVAPAGAPYAHPYYWAPFILMGNWL